MINKAMSRVEDYVLCHLGDMAGCTTEITDDIEEMLIHPDRNQNSESRLENCRKLALANLEYISQGLCDLRELKSRKSV